MRFVPRRWEWRLTCSVTLRREHFWVKRYFAPYHSLDGVVDGADWSIASTRERWCTGTFNGVLLCESILRGKSEGRNLACPVRILSSFHLKTSATDYRIETNLPPEMYLVIRVSWMLSRFIREYCATLSCPSRIPLLDHAPVYDKMDAPRRALTVEPACWFAIFRQCYLFEFPCSSLCRVFPFGDYLSWPQWHSLVFFWLPVSP